MAEFINAQKAYLHHKMLLYKDYYKALKKPL